MKRISHIFEPTVDKANLRAAHFEAKDAIKNKRKEQREARMRIALAWEADLDKNIDELYNELVTGTYRPGRYEEVVVKENGKIRDVWYLIEWRDQVVQRAIMRTLGAKIESSMIPGTYASMKGRGTHKAMRDVWRLVSRTLFAVLLWCFESDFKQYYASILHDILKYLLEQKIKDRRMLNLLFVFIDSFPCKAYLKKHPESAGRGIPIGNILSPLFANFFLDKFDHWAKEVFRAYGYFRYADDIVAIFRTKNEARDFRTEIHRRMEELDLTIKPCEQIYPLRARRIDFVGYTISPNNVRLRKRNERKFRRNAKLFFKHPTKKLAESLSSRWGMIKHVSRGGRFWYSVMHQSIHQIHQQINQEASKC